ncbi:MAG: DUF1573 domain-containing protein [Anaerolineae bacterium]|nr:DUF1573 domain-containing protein [Anaerolineae bacterium]
MARQPIRGWLWSLAALVAVAVVAAGWAWGARQTTTTPAGAPTTGQAGPRIAFDETVYDFGKVPFNQKVEHNFPFRNVGTQPLVIVERPDVEVIQGC